MFIIIGTVLQRGKNDMGETRIGHSWKTRDEALEQASNLEKSPFFTKIRVVRVEMG